MEKVNRGHKQVLDHYTKKTAGFLQEQNGRGSDLPPLCLRGALKLNKSQVLVRRLSLQSGLSVSMLWDKEHHKVIS